MLKLISIKKTYLKTKTNMLIPFFIISHVKNENSPTSWWSGPKPKIKKWSNEIFVEVA